MKTDKIKAPKGHWRHRFATAEVYSWTVIRWNTINQRTINGKYANQPSVTRNPQNMSYFKKNIRIDVSQEDFFDFCSDNEQKILQMMVDGLRPSIDRIDVDGHYTLENIQIISLAENLSKDRMRKREDTISMTSLYGNLYVKLNNRRVYLDSHPECMGLKFIDHLIFLAKPRIISKAIGCWDPLLDTPYVEDPESPAWKAYTEALSRVKEAVSAHDAEQSMARVLQAARDARRAAREARKPIKKNISEYRRLKLWAKSKPEYQEVYEKCCEERLFYDITPQRRAMEILRGMYDGKEGCYN